MELLNAGVNRMTKTEAIAMIKRIQEPEAWEPQINQAAFEALDMAIEALSKELSEDVISRQAAIDAPFKKFDVSTGVTWIPLEHIELLPPAQPDLSEYSDRLWKAAYERGKSEAQTERKKGKWIEPTPEGGFSYDAKAYSECSECGKKEFLGWRKNFCPNCGADMRGEQDE